MSKTLAHACGTSTYIGCIASSLLDLTQIEAPRMRATVAPSYLVAVKPLSDTLIAEEPICDQQAISLRQ